MKKISLILAALLLSACGGKPADVPEKASAESAVVPVSAPEQKVLFDVREIVLKPQKQVELFTGAPVGDCEKGKYGLTCNYEKNGNTIEVVYINGAADWITITNPKFKQFDVPYQLGMNYEKSTGMTGAKIDYQGKFGFYNLSVFMSGAAVDYVYIKAKTP